MTKQDERTRELMELIRPIPQAIWTVDNPRNSLEHGLEIFVRHYGGLNLTR